MAKRIFCVVVYDVQSDRQRNKISKYLEKFGVRVNYSVFECMFTPRQLEDMQLKIQALIDAGEDSVVYYTICRDCYTKTVYQPRKKEVIRTVRVV